MNSVFDILHSWSYRFELGLCCYAIKFGKNLFSEDIWDIENFTFLIHLFEMVWATIHKICRNSSAGCLPMIAHVDMVPNYFHFSFFLGAVFYSDPVRIWSHVSRSCTAGYSGCLVLSWVPWVLRSIHLLLSTRLWVLSFYSYGSYWFYSSSLGSVPFTANHPQSWSQCLRCYSCKTRLSFTWVCVTSIRPVCIWQDNLSPT